MTSTMEVAKILQTICSYNEFMFYS